MMHKPRHGRRWACLAPTLLFSSLILSGLAVPCTVRAQNSSASGIQTVGAITLREDGPRATLRIEGLFDATRFDELLFDPVDSALTMALEIPGAETTPGLPDSQPFSESRWLSRVETSAISVPDEPALGLVTIVLELTPGTTARLDLAGSDASGIQVVLERVRRVPQPEQASAATAATPPTSPPLPLDLTPLPAPLRLTPGPLAMDQATAVPVKAGAEDTAMALPALNESDPRLRLAPWKSRPTRVRIAILNASGISGQAARVAVLLSDIKRVALERTMGMRVEIANVSNAGMFDHLQTVLAYRPGYLRAALQIAKLLPGEQSVEPMNPDMLQRDGLDVTILLGKDLP